MAILTEFCQENTLVIASTLFQWHKRWLDTWTSPDDQYWNKIDYILCNQRWKSSIQAAKTRPGADYGSDHQLLIAKFRLKWKKGGKTTRPFTYDLNQVPYGYTVEVTNRFKGLNMLDRMPEELWTEICNIIQEVVTKTMPKRKETQEGKVIVWGGLPNSWEKKGSKRQRGKGKIYPTKCRVPENSKER